jgi:hypothetical protein
MTDLQYRLQLVRGAFVRAPRAGMPPLLGPAGAAAATLAAALLAAVAINRNSALALVVPALAVSAAVASRFPGATALVVAGLTGTYGTIRAFTDLPVGEAVDIALGGLWLGAIWKYAVTGREHALRLWPAVAGVGLYLIVTALQVFTASSLTVGINAFRASAWYVAAALLLAYGPWSPRTLQRVGRGLVVVALVVGAYAVFRQIVGAAETELRNASEVRIEGEESLIGSFPSRGALGLWCGIAIPFLMAFALGARGRWRLFAIGAGIMCTVGLLGSQVRAGILAVAVATVVVAVLYQLARAFPELRVGGTLALFAGAVLIGGAVFTFTVGGSQLFTERYERIGDPSSDQAVQKRVDRWKIAMEEIERHPFGKGLGTAGRTARGGRFERSGETVINPDNAFLQVGIQQGIAPAVIFGVSLLALVLALGRHAITTRDRGKGLVGIGAAGALVSFMLYLCTAGYAEGLPALFGWIIVGVGLGQFVRAGPAPSSALQEEAPRTPSRSRSAAPSGSGA